MGSCVSVPKSKGCLMVTGSGLNPRRKNHRRRRRRRKGDKVRGDKIQSFPSNSSKVEPSYPPDLSYSNPTYQGTSENFYDPDSLTDSAGDEDDEFYSVQDDISQLGSDVTPRCSENNHHFAAAEPSAKWSEPSLTCSDADFVNDGGNKTPESHICGGLLPNAILPCLVCSNFSEEKIKPQRAHLSSMKKRPSFKLSFKKRDDQPPSLLSPRTILQRPIAGSQIQSCSLEKRMTQSWSRIPPSTFRVRGQNYLKDKKKEYAPNCEAYYPFGVDVFFSPRKIDHIARFVELPSISSSSEIPTMLIVNLQIPLYPASLFQNDYDGEGLNYVFYFKVSDNYSKELPDRFQENFKKIIDGEIEKIRGFPLDTSAPVRERLKILGRIVNVDDLQLTTTEKKLMNTYNEKPVLTRPQHQFYLGENYFEIDLDIHRFSYIARKGFESFFDRMKHCILDFGLTIQGTKAEDLPECMLCCLRLKEIDYTNANQLSF